MNAIQIELIRKITIAAINGVRRAFREIKGRTLQGRIFGVARTAVVEDSGAGIAIKFTGDFRALNAKGERFTGPVCYLPAEAEQLLAAALANNPDSGIEFAFDLYAIESQTPLGYTWECQSLFAPAKSDPYKSVMEKLSGHPFEVAQPVDDEPEGATLVREGEVPEGTIDPAKREAPAEPTKGKRRA